MSRSNPFCFFLSRLTEDYLLLALVVGLVPLLWAVSPSLSELAGLVHWQTLAALTGFLVLSRGLEDSGALARCGVWLMGRFRTERSLALALVVFSWLLAAVVTNDVALFIVVPLTVALAAVVPVPLGRLVIFQALAVNVGSALTPIGNPQNLFLWQTRGIGFGEFMAAMLPLVGLLTLVLLLATVLAFPARPVVVRPGAKAGQPQTVVGVLPVVSGFYCGGGAGRCGCGCAGALRCLMRFRNHRNAGVFIRA